MLTIKIQADADVNLFDDGRYILAAFAIGRNTGQEVYGINIERGLELGYDHQVSIGVDAKYDNETVSQIHAALRDHLGENLCTSWHGGE
jgi:hypothetical protein